jgi:NADH:ubiquinone oxidoreductase subunit 6 (subunit J)
VTQVLRPVLDFITLQGAPISWVVLWWALAAITVAGALVLMLSREVMRAMLGLGCFLLGLAGLYAYYAVPFLAVAQVFVYVGGVLVLFLFAIMALHRDERGRSLLERRFDIGAAAVALGLPALVAVLLRPLWASMSAIPIAHVSADALGSTLLGPMLPQFEAAGIALLAALVAALAIGGGER